MGIMVIACYRPKPGKADTLKDLMKTHLPTLRSEDLVTDRPPQMMTAGDGTLIEVFEWKSPAAIEAAHSNEAVLRMWDEFNQACDFIPIADVAEAQEMFSEFKPFDV